MSKKAKLAVGDEVRVRVGRSILSPDDWKYVRKGTKGIVKEVRKLRTGRTAYLVEFKIGIWKGSSWY